MSAKKTEATILNQESSQEYSATDNHSLNRGDGLGEEVTIKGDVYKVEVNDDGRPRLLRFNKKYKIWVSIEFLGESDGLEKLVQDHLKGQYIRRVLESLKE
jgi:hypothetical protein